MSEDKQLKGMSAVWAHLESGGIIWWAESGGRRVAWLDEHAIIKTDKPGIISGLVNGRDYYVCKDFDRHDFEARRTAEGRTINDLMEEEMAVQSRIIGDARAAVGHVWFTKGRSLTDAIQAKTEWFLDGIEYLERELSQRDRKEEALKCAGTMCAEMDDVLLQLRHHNWELAAAAALRMMNARRDYDRAMLELHEMRP